MRVWNQLARLHPYQMHPCQLLFLVLRFYYIRMAVLLSSNGDRVADKRCNRERESRFTCCLERWFRDSKLGTCGSLKLPGFLAFEIEGLL